MMPRTAAALTSPLSDCQISGGAGAQRWRWRHASLARVQRYSLSALFIGRSSAKAGGKSWNMCSTDAGMLGRGGERRARRDRPQVGEIGSGGVGRRLTSGGEAHPHTRVLHGSIPAIARSRASIGESSARCCGNALRSGFPPALITSPSILLSRSSALLSAVAASSARCAAILRCGANAATTAEMKGGRAASTPSAGYRGDVRQLFHEALAGASASTGRIASPCADRLAQSRGMQLLRHLAPRVPAALVVAAAATILVGLLGGEAAGVSVVGDLPNCLRSRVSLRSPTRLRLKC